MIDRLIRSAFVVLAATLPLTVAACGRVPGQFEILNDQVPSTTMCAVPINVAVYQGKGTLDVSIVRSDLGSAYFFFPLMQNNLPRGSTGTIDPNQIELSGFDIDITPQDPAGLAAPIAAVFQAAAGTPLVHHQTSWSGTIASGGGQLTAIVPAFPLALAQNLAAAGGLGAGAAALTVNLRVQARGMTTNGTDMQSDPFDFPVDICSGCLVASTGPCPFMTAAANLGNSCNPAQDQPVDCCTDNGALVCPPTVATQ
jgi:hypothetical protein